MRGIFYYGILSPVIGFVAIVFGSLWLEPISWFAGFEYELWDIFTFIASQPFLMLYLASVVVGWGITHVLSPRAYPVYVVNADEIGNKENHSSKD